ncbi:MAG: rRNA maturation RNase YbeY [Proteobacteria bacterium]|nr:rRNA maturation RNase YbeY [Pseudomonadota bacterium]
MPTKNTRSASARGEARVRVQNASRSRRVPASARFRSWVRAAAAGPADVTVRLVGAAEGRRLNLAYRGKDYATNVLTFAYAAGSGDIVICPSVVAREAAEQGKPLEQHYAHLTVHGVLHMRGYDHDSPADAMRMERAEIRILKRLGHPNPYLI